MNKYNYLLDKVKEHGIVKQILNYEKQIIISEKQNELINNFKNKYKIIEHKKDENNILLSEKIRLKIHYTLIELLYYNCSNESYNYIFESINDNKISKNNKKKVFELYILKNFNIEKLFWYYDYLCNMFDTDFIENILYDFDVYSKHKWLYNSIKRRKYFSFDNNINKNKYKLHKIFQFMLNDILEHSNNVLYYNFIDSKYNKKNYNKNIYYNKKFLKKYIYYYLELLKILS